MSYLSSATNSQTVTVATEIALATIPINLTGIPSGAQVVVSGVVSCAAGTAGTTAAVKVRQGVGVAGTQVGATITGPVQTGGLAVIVPFMVQDNAPPSNGQYTVTLTFTANTSSVVTSTVMAIADTGILND
jgi:hypothetical protein